MVDSSLDFRMGARITISPPSGTVDFEDTTSEGAVDGGRYPVHNFRVGGDSIAFTFAPAGVQVFGRCVGPDSVAGHFVYPVGASPPKGLWSMRRSRAK
jgi:hypothetical protein